MQNKPFLIFGILLILVGLSSLAGVLFKIDLGKLLCPSALILIGIWLIVRPRILPGTGVDFRLLGDIRRRGTWEVTGEEFWVFVGDIKLDLTTANLPPGETKYRAFGFIGSVKATVPPGVGVSVASAGFVTDARLFGERHEGFLNPVEFTSPGYADAERKVRIESLFFVHDVKIVN